MDYLRNIKFLIQQINNKNVNNMEKRAFTINDDLLSDKEQIISEFVRLTAFMGFDADFETDIYGRIIDLLDKLDTKIDDCDWNNLTEIETFKKIIVYIGLNIGSKVSFYKTFHNMLINDELFLKNDMNYTKQFDFFYLYDYYYKRTYFQQKKDDNKLFFNSIEKESKNINNIDSNKNHKEINISDVYDNLNKNINKILIKAKENSINDFDKYRDFSIVLNQLKKIINDKKLTDEEIIFIKKIITYSELEYGVDVSYINTFKDMIENDELNTEYELLTINNEFSIELLKQHFNYEHNNKKGI